ncbi:MAG: MFS transporter [Anaerolineae bacterium]|nr:MFS transporter [Anaerolineae bacterium]
MDDQDDATTSSEDASQSRANFRYLVRDIAWFGLAVPATARFLSVYAIRLDASAALLGWIAALPSLIALITSSWAAWWRGRYPTMTQAMWWPGLLYRLTFLLPAFTPLFPSGLQPWWLVAAVALPAAANGISSVLFLVLMRQAVEPPRLTVLLGRRSLAFNLAVGMSTLAFGFWLELMPFPVNYQVMFVVSFVLSLGSFINIQRTRELAPADIPSPDQSPVRPWQSPIFRRIALIAAFVHIAFFFISAIIPLRLMNELGADEAFMSVYSVAELAAAALIASVTYRIVRRIGALMVIAIGLGVAGVAAGVLVIASSLPLTMIGAMLSGAGWTMAAISLFGYFSENAPAENLTRFMTVYNQVVLLAVFVGPLLGSQLANTSLSLTTVLALGMALRLAAAGFVALDCKGWLVHIRRWPPVFVRR